MQARQLTRMFLFSAFACWLSAQAGESVKSATSDLHMSADLQQHYLQEMRALLTGVQQVAASLPVADWKQIGATGAAMRHSYVLEKELTKQQRDEIERLPEEFQALDEDFHLRAGKLEQAASVHDAESVAFQFSRLLEACTTCHTKFARTRFPAFATPNVGDHRH